MEQSANLSESSLYSKKSLESIAGSVMPKDILIEGVFYEAESIKPIGPISFSARELLLENCC